jgi:dihydrofolate reductase
MITIIAAVAKNRAIGFKNKLIYWLPNDLKRFKALTTGHTIIMGRNTYLSLPKGALPNRRNVVLSKTMWNVECGMWNENSPSADSSAADSMNEGNLIPHSTFHIPQKNIDVFPSLDEALAHCAPDEDIYIIGGASVYRQALSIADRLCLTEIDDTPAEADTFFPPYEDDWQEVLREDHPIDEKHAYRYAFVDYIRKQNQEKKI